VGQRFRTIAAKIREKRNVDDARVEHRAVEELGVAAEAEPAREPADSPQERAAGKAGRMKQGVGELAAARAIDVERIGGGPEHAVARDANLLGPDELGSALGSSRQEQLEAVDAAPIVSVLKEVGGKLAL